MVVGRTLWDFIIEMAMTQGIGAMLLAVFVLLEIIIIVVLLIYSGILSIRLNYGVLDLEMHHLTIVVWTKV
ncbi:MAG: hypothetical protein WB392_07350 [Methanotrichaceae archaeon]